MMSIDIEGMTIGDISRQLRSKKLSPVELTNLFLQRIKRLNPVLNAYVTLTEERACADAKTAEKEISLGRYRGPLHGIPFSIKDNLATRRIRTTAGSKVLTGWVPHHDATVVERLRKAGAVILGKTNMHEWASGGTTINPYYGTTCNPWDLKRIPGGSSGGSASAVAANLCLASIGTDNAGSVRNPASFCGTVGLKATYGRVSRYGDVPGTGGFSTDHFGIFTKTISDCATVLKRIAGYDARDPLSSEEPVPNYSRDLGKTVKGLKFGVLRGYFEENFSAEVKTAIDEAARLLRSLGMKKVEFSIPHMDLIPAVQTVTSRVENIVHLMPHMKSRPDDFSRPLLHRLIGSMMIPASSYVTAQRVRRIICEEFDKAFEKLDVILTPTTPITAPTIEECQQGFVEIDGKRIALQPAGISLGTTCTVPFNVTGLPAVSLCCGFSSLGLPIGLQIVGGNFAERAIFQVAHAYEQAARWFQRRPVIGDTKGQANITVGPG
jgi:aspartyl-tRNA(Asn)/glutamyl-tRNA(Gln) amidotransferase subunit A